MPPNRPAPSKELHVFSQPGPGATNVIQFQVPEFTCHAPADRPARFAHFTIDMIGTTSSASSRRRA